MKITDLMYGDWFNSKKGTCRINEIKLFTAIVEYSDEAYQTNGNISATELDFEYQLEPIVIQDEMLIATGFQVQSYGRNTERECWIYKDDTWEVKLKLCMGGSLEIKYRGNRLYRGGNIHCVHQLQHALRLAGFDQLADNFTLIEKPLNQ